MLNESSADAVFYIANIFKSHGMENSKQEAEALVSDLLKCSRAELYQNHLLDEKEWKTAQLWAKRRLSGEPLVYISGIVEFYGCTLSITPAVLIPRPETEILVDKVSQSLLKQHHKGKVLWDLCCGSGCIGISLKKKFPELSVYLSDLSREAIALAADNASANHVKVVCLQGDLLSPFQGQKADYVVCNPPYLSEKEYAVLDRDVKDFEPAGALVAGVKGTEIYERLARELPSHLNPHAQIWFEIGYRQGELVKKIFQTPHWKNQKVENDWASHNRFFFLENE